MHRQNARHRKKELVEYFKVVGIMEEFDRMLIVLKRILGWHTPFYTRQNVNLHRARKEDLTPETLRVIEAYNALDIELYRYAKQLFEKQICSQGPAFEAELQRFKKLNEVYTWVHLLLSARRERRRRALSPRPSHEA